MNILLTTGQVVTIAVGETYTLKIDEVMINEVIYRKTDLEISLQGNDPLALSEKVKIGVNKRDGVKNLPAIQRKTTEWTIDGVVQTVLATCIEAISVGIR